MYGHTRRPFNRAYMCTVEFVKASGPVGATPT